MPKIFAILFLLSASTASYAQINLALADGKTKTFFIDANNCLNEFNDRAISKKLSVEVYKTALQGACARQIHELQMMHELTNYHEMFRNDLVKTLEQNIQDAKDEMVTKYAMK